MTVVVALCCPGVRGDQGSFFVFQWWCTLGAGRDRFERHQCSRVGVGACSKNKLRSTTSVMCFSMFARILHLEIFFARSDHYVDAVLHARAKGPQGTSKKRAPCSKHRQAPDCSPEDGEADHDDSRCAKCVGSSGAWPAFPTRRCFFSSISTDHLFF